MLVKQFLCCLFCASAVWAASPYTVPEPIIEVFSPKGLRVSIPDHDGIRLFAFHGVVNRDLNGLEAGDLSQDILKPTNGRWVFEDRKLKLNPGDVLNFWLFVIKGKLGYRLDDQTYTISQYEHGSFGSINNGNRPNRRTTTPSYSQAYPQNIPEFKPPQSDCNCPCNQQLPPITIIPPICIQPTPQKTTTEVPASTTVSQAPTYSVEERVLRELLAKLSTENSKFREQVSELRQNQRLLVSKLERIGDEYLKMLLLSGRISKDDNPRTQVVSILSDKLQIYDSSIVKAAVRNTDGSITFEFNTVDEKLFVLRTANEKLKNSAIKITDIDNAVLEPRFGR